MKVEGVKIDCHDCTRCFYIDKEIVGWVELCPFCHSPDILAYNEANIYIGKLLNEEKLK